MPLTNAAVNALNLGRGGSYSISRDVVKHYLWDTWILPAVVTDHTFFQQGVGSAYGAAAKTLNETDLFDAGKLPNGQTFLIKRIGVVCVSAAPLASVAGATIAQSFINILQSSVWDIVVEGRTFDLRFPGSKLTPNLAVSTITTATINAARVGDYVSSGWVPIDDFPIYLDTLVSFNVTAHIGNPIAATLVVINANAFALNALGATIQVVLEGVLTRSK
jgi:hypothetical protein